MSDEDRRTVWETLREFAQEHPAAGEVALQAADRLFDREDEMREAGHAMLAYVEHADLNGGSFDGILREFKESLGPDVWRVTPDYRGR